MGAMLGLYRALAAPGGLSCPELAALRAPSSATFANGSTPRSQAARSSTLLRAAGTRFDPSGPSPASDPGSPVYLAGFFQTALGSVLYSSKIVERGRSGDGFGWHEHVHDVHDGCESFIRPGSPNG
jgi:hypothetical protein